MKPVGDMNASTVPVEFRNQILTKFSGNEAGQLCQTDPSILTFGQRLYDKMKRKQHKASEVAQTVRMDIRHLASLFIAPKKVLSAEQCYHSDSLSTLVRSHFSALEETSDVPTVETTTRMVGNWKSALKSHTISFEENDKNSQGHLLREEQGWRDRQVYWRFSAQP